jgi:cyclase
MKKIITFSVLLITVYSAMSQSRYKYEVEKVVEDVYVLKPRNNPYRWVTANIVVIVNSDDVLVVDSGLLPEAGTEAIKEIKKITPKPVKYLINTHWHGDHWQGNEVFAKEYPGLEIISAEGGFKGIKRNGVMWVQTFYPKYLQMMIDNYEADVKRGGFEGEKPLDEAQMKELKEGLDQTKTDLESVKKIKLTLPTLTFSDKMTIRKGDREFQFFYLGIGNTIGDAILYLPKEKILIPGDLVVYPSPYESGAFSKEWVDTSKKLRDFDFNFLIPGHGRIQKDYNYLDYLNALFTEVSSQINQAFLAGKTTADEAAKVVTHESVINELNKNQKYIEYTKRLDPGFVSSAVQDSYKRAMIGLY